MVEQTDHRETPSVPSNPPPPGRFRRYWRFLNKPSAKFSLLTLLAVGFVGGVIFWGGFNTGMEASNKLEFCVSCHEMRSTVYEEYKQTIHYANRTGVRAICSDCHVPRDWTHKLIRKVQATNELYGKLVGSIDTVEKFEARRLTLARHEWARMKANNSAECRNCHSFEGMNTEKQKPRAKTMHKLGMQDQKTCIDCHKGIAHKKPEGMTDEEAG